MPLDPGFPLIDAAPPRVLFAELVAGALDRTGIVPSPHAVAYLVDLRAAEVRVLGKGNKERSVPLPEAFGRAVAERALE